MRYSFVLLKNHLLAFGRVERAASQSLLFFELLLALSSRGVDEVVDFGHFDLLFLASGEEVEVERKERREMFANEKRK